MGQTPMDLSDRYVRMCAGAEVLQSWWRKAPWEDENGTLTEEFFVNNVKPIRSHIAVGDFIHHGKDPTRRAHVPQQVSIITNRVVVADKEGPHFKYEYSWQVGGHYPWITHYQEGDPREEENPKLEHFVWLPRLDQIVKHDCLGPLMMEGAHYSLSEFLRFIKMVKSVMWVETADGEKEIVARTLEQAALMTHMWRAYGKVWIEESLAWVPKADLLLPAEDKI